MNALVRRAALAAAWGTLSLGGAAQGVVAPVATEVCATEACASEARVREVALGLVDGSREFDGLASTAGARDDWRVRVAQLEAQVRAARLGAAVTDADLRGGAAQHDPHPNVRTWAYELAALAPEVSLSIPVEPLDWPAERAAFARCAWRAEVPEELVLDLLVDADERVRAAARGALARRMPSHGSVARAFDRVGAEGALPLARALRWAWIPGDGASRPDAGVLEAAVAVTRFGDVVDAAVFVRSWSGAPRSWWPVSFEAAETGRPEVATALFEALVDEPDADADLRELWNEAWSRAEPDDARLLRLALHGFDAVPLDVLDAQLAYLEVRAWPEGSEGWLDAGLAEEHVAALVDAAAYSFDLVRRSGPESGARRFLLAALDVPAVEAAAFRTLAAHEGPYAEELYRAWSVLEPDEALVRTAWFAEHWRIEPFRADLLALGDHADLRRCFALERLAAFVGDAEVLARVRRWFHADLRDVARVDVDPAAKPRPAVETRLLAGARALAVLDPARGVESIASALEIAGTRSDELGKELAGLLGRTAPGRRALAGFLDARWRRRVRVEAAIALVGADDGDEAGADAAAAVLRTSDGALARDLRARSVEALGGHHGPETRRFLAGVAGDERAPEEVRRAAVDALGRLGAVLELETLAMDAPFDARRRALGRLGALGASALEPLGRSEGALARAELSGEERELLEDEWLAARASAGPLGARLASLLDDARAAFDADLRTRWAGTRTTSAEFRWRGELAALGAELARRGDVDAVLDELGAWWAVDGELLVEVAGLVTLHGVGTREDGSGSLAGAPFPREASLRRPFAAAAVALEGEGGRERRVARLRLSYALVALGDEDYTVAARVLDALRADLAEGRLPREALGDVLGGDPELQFLLHAARASARARGDELDELADLLRGGDPTSIARRQEALRDRFEGGR